MFKNRAIYRGFACLSASLMLLSSTAGQVLEANKNMVNSYLGTKTTLVEVSDSDELYTAFTADYSNTEELVAAHRAMGERVSAEGTVLLKNNGALPLAPGSKVTLLGIGAEDKMNSGARVGVSVAASQNVKLGEALAGKGFDVNPVMQDVYTTIGKGKAYRNANKLSPSFVGVLPGEEPKVDLIEAGEKDFANANAAWKGSLTQYPDAAIVVLSRSGSEGADYYPGETGVDPSKGARNPSDPADRRCHSGVYQLRHGL